VLAQPGNLVIRVSWVFGPQKPAFPEQVFDDALAGRPLAAVADKFSLPTCTSDLAAWLAVLLESDAQGLLHACNAGEAVSWHGMAELVVDEMMACGVLGERPQIARLALEDMTNFRARRARFTVMETRRLSGLVGTVRPWKEALAEHIRTRCNNLESDPKSPVQ
jgi:dTDP-4-dehydrorhamnose reductase